MTIRADLCALRDRTDWLERELAEIEQRLASRNTAHLVSRARSTTRATFDLISQALQLPLEEVAAEKTLPAGAAR